jgi:CubicO group peptidase (beta-lactamase class C family)
MLISSLLVLAGLQAMPQASDTTRAPDLTAADLGPFFDGLIPAELARHDIAGAVVSVVKGGQVLFAKGYGYADVARKIPVSPEKTLFRIASISKLFNATAVMQLVEQGKLDLDEDIARYLDFEIPRRYPDKITLRNLLTHTAGFEETFKQLPADSGKSVPLAAAVRKVPPQLYRPGTVTSYSNYGADLAGYIVERVSGTPFPEYVRLHILVPLGMTSSSFAEPLPSELRARVSREYDVASDSAGEFEILQGEPSGNMSSTALDMTRFALAHLQLGQLDGVRILAESTARLMARTQFRTHPDVPGMGLGFFEESRNGYRIIGHGGDLSRFHSHLSLLMDEGVGIFLSVNSAGSGGGIYGAREAIRDGFLDRYFPRRIPIEPIVQDPKVDARRAAGHYTLSRRGASTLAAVAGLAFSLDVEPTADGSIQIAFLSGPNGRPIRWYPIGNLVFRTASGAERVGFVTDDKARVIRMAYVGGHELHRIGLTDTRRFAVVVMGTALAVLLGVLLLWPVAALARRLYQRPRPDDGLSPRLRGATRVVAAIDLAFLVGIGLFVALAFGGKISPDRRSDPILIGVRLVGVIGILGTVPVLWAALRSVRAGASRLAQVKYVALGAACLVFSWFVVHWNLVAVGTGY